MSIEESGEPVAEDGPAATSDPAIGAVRMDLPTVEESGLQMMKAATAVRARLARAQAAVAALGDHAVSDIRADWDENAYPGLVECLDTLHAAGELLRRVAGEFGDVDLQLAAGFEPGSIQDQGVE